MRNGMWLLVEDAGGVVRCVGDDRDAVRSQVDATTHVEFATEKRTVVEGGL
jgi:hypothetical protein